ncbi:MAG: SpoVG family protein [Acutalibacteraceae bacterium]
MATTKKKQQETTTPQVEARIDRLVDGDFKTKAFASATIGGAFAVHGIRVIESDKGRFISMPQDSYKKNGETKYNDTFHAITADARNRFGGCRQRRLRAEAPGATGTAGAAGRRRSRPGHEPADVSRYALKGGDVILVRFTIDNRNRLIFYGNTVGYVKDRRRCCGRDVPDG